MKRENTFIIAFEGPDKVGKQTQSELLKEALQEKLSRKHTVTPGGPVYELVDIQLYQVPTKGCIGYDKIYEMLKPSDTGTALALQYPEAFQAFQVANRLGLQEKLNHQSDNIIDDLTYDLIPKYRIIILDRWTLSSIAYGLASGLDEDFIQSLNEGLLEPDVWLVFLNDSFSRKEKGDDAYEKVSTFQQKVRQNYMNWVEAGSNTKARHVFKAQSTVESTHSQVMSVIEKYIEDFLGSPNER